MLSNFTIKIQISNEKIYDKKSKEHCINTMVLLNFESCEQKERIIEGGRAAKRP